MLNVITLTISIIAQLAAAFMALKLIAKDRRNAGWIAIAGAIFIMCIRRVIAGYYVVYGNLEEPSELTFSLIDLVISLVIFIGVILIKYRFMAIEKITENLRQSEERYALAAQGATDGLWDWDLTTGKLYLSPRWKHTLGYEDRDIVNSPEAWFGLVHPDDLDGLRVAISNSIAEDSFHFEHEYRIREKNGTYSWVLCRGMAMVDSGNLIRMAGSQTDIMIRKVAEQLLQHDANHDVLTGLPNRALMERRLERLIEERQKNNKFNYAMLYVDIDGFKEINDSLGHQMGDLLLIQISRRLESCLRPGDMIAREGGDEFTILLDNIDDPHEAVVSAKRILSELNAPFKLLKHQLQISVSIGIALGDDGSQAKELIHNSDTAMYAAKTSGKNRYEFFDSMPERRRLVLAKPPDSISEGDAGSRFATHKPAPSPLSH
ncbi:MAG: diguanylate cyclase domain-containing protein [Planctomycetota bacterium]|jgi:diguanylate cyclase (GGDEF)-like protein/PAS domain S-box-containing protein